MAGTTRWTRCSAVAVVVAILAVGGCALVQPTIPVAGGSSGGAPQAQAHGTWVAGDSISRASQWPSHVTPAPLPSVAESRTGFLRAIDGRTIGSNLTTAIARNGVPDRVVIMGGVNDVRIANPPSIAAITAAMAALEAEVTAQGVTVIWATEPAWTYAGPVGQINQWMRTRPHVIDCAGSVNGSPFNTYDGVHPTAAANDVLGRCISARL